MNFRDLQRQYNIKETKTTVKDNEFVKQILIEYMKKHKLVHPITGNYIEDLLHNYFLLKSNGDVKSLENIMEKYQFNYSMSIHNAIYYLLGQEIDLMGETFDPLLWPGIEKIESTGETYTLKTSLGEIKVSKASELFKNTKSKYIFNKPLMGLCHERSYEFLKENQDDYYAVLSYMPNFFQGGHYHSYIESNDSIIDIAANSYYQLKEDSNIVLNGKIIKKMTYKEIERKHNELEHTIPNLKKMKNCKLLTLALYYDYKNK